MKTIFKNIAKIITVSSIFLSLSSYAQAPQKMSYQAVLRNANNTLVSNTPVAMRVSVLQGSASGTAVYVERHTLTTNINGLATFEIGAGTLISGAFATINWASGQYFVKTETDPAGGTNYSISGTSQLLSVPYALYAKTAGTTTGGTVTETDPVWTAAAANYYTKNNMQASGSSQLHFNNLTNKPTTLAGYGIIDALNTSHAANGITTNNITNWNSAFAWGNHAGLYRPIGYVPGWSEVTNKPAFAPIATSGNYNDLTNKPVLDGSETRITAGTNVTVTGAGTIASPYVVNSTGTTGTPSPQWTTTGNNISNTNTGNVGIGTTNPMPFYGSGKTMTVASSGTGDTFGANIVLSSNSTTNAGQIGAITFAQPEITASDKRIGVIYSNLDNFPSGTSQAPKGIMGFGIQNGSGNSTAMIIDSDQSVKVKKLGIDMDLFTGTPNAPLQFGNGAGGRKIVLYEGANNEHQYYGFGINSGSLRYQVETITNDHIFYSGSSATTSRELMRINGNGNVGIGASDPGYKLDIGGRMRIRSVTGETAGVWLNNNANTALGAFIGMQADNKVGFYGSGSGWGLTMNTASGALSINGSAGASGQVPTSNGDNQATSWTKLGNLLQSYYRYPQYPANVPTADPKVSAFGGGSMAIATPGKSRLIISAMFLAYADCGVCTFIRSGDIRLKVNGVSTNVFTIQVSPNGVQQTTLSNYFYDVLGGNHTLEWEFRGDDNYPVTSAFIRNVTVMVLPID